MSTLALLLDENQNGIIKMELKGKSIILFNLFYFLFFLVGNVLNVRKDANVKNAKIYINKIIKIH